MHKSPQNQTTDEWLTGYNTGSVSQIKPRVDERPRLSPAEDKSSIQDDLPLIEPGTYCGRYVRHELHKDMFGERTCKLCIKFEVSGNGILEAWYEVDKTKNGFSVSKRSKYAHQFFSVFPDSTETRMDRLSPKKFKGIDLEIEVTTVSKDSNRNPKPKALHYSKVKRIIGRKK